MPQTSLHLRIINMTSLPDGGPLEVSVQPGGSLEAGRDSGLDWCLPDTQRFISSRHFEIRSERDGWMLYDVSTNGTFLNGGATRVKSPALLQDGDRLQVGQYSIEIRNHPVSAPLSDPLPERPVMRGLPGGLDPWAVQPPAEASVSRPDPARPVAPHWAQPETAPQSLSPSQGAGRAGGDGRVSSDIWSMPAATSPSGAAPLSASPAPEGFMAPPVFSPKNPVPPAPVQGAAPPMAAPPVQADQAHVALLESIEAAAGLAHGTLSRGDPQTIAREIGETLRALTEELSGLLQARAVARRSVRSAQVTMIGREDNNPLKFMPTPDQALGVMFGPPRPGFQRGPAAVRAGFADIKTHQYATHAALQPALAHLLQDLSPEAIEKRLDGVRLNRKARAWELFVERWDAKVQAHDNGMLDVFLALFADAYDRESGRGKDQSSGR